MEKAKIGILGCGSIAWHVVHGYMLGPAKRGQAEIVATCDLREAMAKSAAEWCNAKKIYTTPEELFKDEEIDGVQVLVPPSVPSDPSLHRTMVIAAAEAGKHVSCICPLSDTVRDADDMIKATKNAGVKFQWAEHELYYPPTRKAKELIESGEIGKPRIITLTRNSGYMKLDRIPSPIRVYSRTTSPQDAEHYFQEMKAGRTFQRARGSAKVPYMIHHRNSVARLLMGEFKEVLWAGLVTPEDPITVITWTHRKDGVGIHRECAIPGVYVESFGIIGSETRTEVMGTDGVIWINGPGAELALTPRPADLIMYKDDTTTHFENIEGMMESLGGFKQMTEDFVDCILNEDKTPKSTGEDGKASAQFILAIAKAYEEGKSIAPDSITE